jgi:hypothetical protein
LQLVDDAKFAPRSSTNRGHFTPWTTPSVEPTHNTTAGFCGNSSSKSDLMVSNAKKSSQPAASVAGSSNSTPRNRDMNCHTCGGRGHFKKDCPNRKVMLINEETAKYETRDDADPESDCWQEDENGSLDAYATHLPTIVCSPKVLSVSPHLPSAASGPMKVIFFSVRPDRRRKILFLCLLLTKPTKIMLADGSFQFCILTLLQDAITSRVAS